MVWAPTRFVRAVNRNEKSSTGVARIKTDKGTAYLKALGNAEGPHALVREWVGTSVARWFGLTTFDFAQIPLYPGFDIRLGRGKSADPGPAFVTRAVAGGPWSGDPEPLASLVNREELTILVIVDTWLLNEDRFPPEGSARKPNYDNVFLSREGLSKQAQRLVAMDFTHSLRPASMLSNRIADIANTKDERLYGLFPAFESFLSAASYEKGVSRLGEVSKSEVHPFVAQVPAEWDVTDALRDAVVQFLVQRAAYLVKHLPSSFGPIVHSRGGP